ncbi:hypothetical protein EC957_008677 [Mortierella hygrophila]|uniref:Uncharacterized protein n=1 Tax=Mortierella hygrophila TaxID=979708 RepID=A0A9P6EXE3_9FUNG|nr:hypothetical protein EC957_008677 [Mortierella hygrophila]
MAARDTALKAPNTPAQVDIPVPSQEEAAPLRSSDPSGGTNASSLPTSTAPVADPDTFGQLLGEKMMERHHIFLETFIERATAEHTKFIVSMTEHHMTSMQAFAAAQVQQDTDLQSAVEEQHRKILEKQRACLDSQQRALEQLLSEQRLIKVTVGNLLSAKRKRSFTLEVDEQTFKRIQNDPSYIVRSAQDK